MDPEALLAQSKNKGNLRRQSQSSLEADFNLAESKSDKGVFQDVALRLWKNSLPTPWDLQNVRNIS